MPRTQSETLTAAELRLMDILWEKGEATVTEVMEALPQDPPLAYNTVLTTLRILERKGYVLRQRHPSDRRAYLVQATETGRVAKVRAVAILDEQQNRFLAPLTPAQRHQLGALLSRLQQPSDRMPGE